MTRPQAPLPHLHGRALLTDGGLETTLVFHDGIDLPAFAAFVLLDSDDGRARLKRYYQHYLRIAAEQGRGFLLEAPTWRANRDWAESLGYDAPARARINRDAIALLVELRDACAKDPTPIVISGCIGPRADGYTVAARMSSQEAADYHAEQIHTFAGTAADLASAYTLNYVEEAIGIVRAGQQAGLPVVISFTVDTDGHLPSGQPLGEAIAETDAATRGGPVYYMINCAHPSHFADVLAPEAPWLARVRGLRANASCKSHAELDAATELDIGDPSDLAVRYERLRSRLPRLAVIGGCCGTDHRHVSAIGAAFAD